MTMFSSDLLRILQSPSSSLNDTAIAMPPPPIYGYDLVDWADSVSVGKRETLLF